MNIRFYKSFSKRKNSTKRPSASDNYNDRNCHLKEDTSIDNPSIVLSNREGNISQTGNPVTTSNAIASNANSCSVSFSPIQDTSGGVPSPSNPCAITGRTEINLNVNGNIINVPFGETVYGGTTNITGGGTVNKYLYLDLGSVSWNLSGVRFYAQFNISVPSAPYAPDGNYNYIANACCVEYAITSRAGIESLNEHFCIHRGGSSAYITIHDERFTDAATFRTAMSGVYICYELYTTTTISTGAHVVPLNEGSNTISANADSITINYDISTSGDLPLNYSYAYIDHFKKYYFVSAPAILTDGTIQYDLVEDTMATHKTAIGNTVAQIAYSSTGYDTMKVDTRLAVKTTKTITSNKDAAGIFNGSGCYVLGLSNVDSGTSIICYYAMDQAELNSFMNEVATDTNLKDSVKNYCTDVWDAIVSCIWIPVEISEIPGTSGVNIKVSNYTCTTTGKKISNPPNRASSVSVSIPWTYSDFRRTAPYTSLNAWLPGFGYISLNASDLVAESSIKFNYMVDCMTGDCCCRIIDGTDSDIIFQTVSYNMAISIPLSRYTQDAQAFIGNTASFVGNAASLMASIPVAAFNPGGTLASAVGTVASGAQLCLGANSRDVSIKGTLGGRAIVANGVDTAIVAFSMDTEDPNDANYIARWGRPVGVTHAISNHSGYVQCVDASVAIAGDTWERDEINSYLNSGFYYE